MTIFKRKHLKKRLKAKYITYPEHTTTRSYSTSCLLYYYLSLWSFAVRDEDDRKLVNNALYLLYVLILIFFAPIMLRREEPKNKFQPVTSEIEFYVIV